MNIKTLRPMRPDAEQIAHYGIGEKLDMEYLPRKIALPGNLKECEEIAVRPDMIDTNNHVNNGQYINIAMALMAQDGEYAERKPVKRVLAEYKKSAVMGDVFHPYTGMAEDKYYVCLKDGTGNINAIVVFEQ
jgi:medium-chain acyl-[acyl-carrier-protein] hydrolase